MELSTISDLFISHIIIRDIFWNRKKGKGEKCVMQSGKICDHNRKGEGHRTPKTPQYKVVLGSGYGDFAMAKEKLN